MARSRASRRPGRAAALAAGALTLLAHAADAPRAADPAPDAASWTAIASDGVSARAEPITAAVAPALRLAYDFHGGAGFAAAERHLALDFPANFELRLQIRKPASSGPVEIKFVDASGDNVWWYRPPGSLFTGEWQTLRIRKRQIEFAWGPAADRALRHTERFDVVVNAGGGSAQGTIDIGPLTLAPLPPPPAEWPVPVASASGSGAMPPSPSDAPRAVWRCSAGAGDCALVMDYGVSRELGGLRLEWADARRAANCDVALSEDGRDWRTVRRVTDAGGRTDWLRLGESDARFVRITCTGPNAHETALTTLALLDVALGASDTALITEVARTVRRGTFPRGFSEQSYWTLVGLDGGADSALLSEDGALELGRGGPSIEPFVVEGGRTVTWADVTHRQTLAGGYLPIPTDEWRADDFTLAVTAVGDRGVAGTGLWARYRLQNRTAHALHVRLALVARPFQVNPPAQFLTTPGGVSPIDRVAWDGRVLTLNDRWHIVPVQSPAVARGVAFDSGQGPDDLGGEPGRAAAVLTDAAHLGSGTLAFDLELPAHGRSDIGLFVPWAGRAATADAPPLAMHDLLGALGRARAFWAQRLNRVTVRASGSAEARDVTDGLRTALAHILLSRSGPLLRPGTRAYARSWIRDGAMMSDALLRLGETAAPRDYLEAFARYVFPSGKVPCCVDERGADPVPEHDSPGEFIHLAAQVLRMTGAAATVRTAYPQVRAAAGYLDRLRGEPPPAGDAATDALYRGLLPPSISHEGYSAKPMHSYWDDFWALRGYADAVFIANWLGQPADAAAFEASRQSFAHDVLASLGAVAKQRAIDFVPGAADLGDFDATSTTIALAPGLGGVALPPALLDATFERYWREFVARRDGTHEWRDYTPYEWRVVGTFVRLGSPERAHAALRYFLDGRRPAGWQQWPEVVDREPRRARFIGDLPHGWVASDFMRSTLDLFAFERESDGSIVLAAGLPPEWLDGAGVEVRGLRTGTAALSYTLRHRPGRTELALSAAGERPRGGFVYRPADGGAHARALLNGHPVAFDHGELRIERAPATLILLES